MMNMRSLTATNIYRVLFIKEITFLYNLPFSVSLQYLNLKFYFHRKEIIFQVYNKIDHLK